MKFSFTIWIALLITLLILFACEKYEEDPDFPSTAFIAKGKYQGDYWPTQEWKECAPEEVGMDSEKLKELNDEVLILKKIHVDIHSILIIRDGYIVAEQYYSEDFPSDSLHPVYSCTKSVTSALFGVAMEQGFDVDLNDRMIGFFPDKEIANPSENKSEITLEHMLTMSDGLEWYELEYPYGDERNTYRQWINDGAGVQFVLDRPSTAAPGEVFSYSTGISHVLSAILQRITGVRTDSFAREELFAPIGITNYYWAVDNDGTAYGGSTLRLKPRDMARFGYLFLKNGAWDGDQVVPGDWVEASHQMHIKRKYIPDSYYGYHWWVSPEGSYSAVGYAGQWITIIPEHDLVVVFTDDFLEGDSFQWDTPQRLIDTYILPAIR